MTPRLQRILFVFSFLFTLILFAAPSQSSMAQDSRTYFEVKPCDAAFPERFNAQCGDLVVPEDRADSDSPMIRVAVAILPSRRQPAAPDPVIFLIGGPGSELIRSIAERGAGGMIDGWRMTRDVILVDQRGIGLSQPALNCPEVDGQDLNSYAGEAEAEAGLMDALTACAARLTSAGIDLPAYNTLANADDIAELPLVLGYEQANYVGLSYGSYVVLNTLRRHPDVVRSVVLEGVTAPDINPVTRFGTAFEHALREMIAACGENARCAEAFPQLEQVTFGVIERLNASPATVTIPDASTGGELEALITGRQVISVLGSQLNYPPPTLGMMPLALHALAAEQYAAIMPMLQGQAVVSSDVVDDYWTTGAHYAYRCTDNVYNETEAAFAEQMDTLHPALHTYYRDDIEDRWQNCAAWAAGAGSDAPVDASALEPVVSDIPVLILSGRFDPVTPPEYAEHVLETLANGYHYVFPTMGHGIGASSNTCGIRIMAAFLDDPMSEPDAACIAREAPITFMLP